MSTKTHTVTDHDVAIIGMACIFPDADDTRAFWQNLCAAKSSFRPIPPERWDHSLFHSDVPREHDKTYVNRGAFLADVARFAALDFGIAPKRVSVMDPQHRLWLETAQAALADAGLENRPFDRRMMGTFVGVSSSEYRNFQTARMLGVQMLGGAFGQKPGSAGAQAISQAVAKLEPVSAFSIPGMLLNMTAANTANQFGLGGPAYTVDAACASALVAVHDAVIYLRQGVCDSAVAGGVYLNLTPENLIGFARAGAISKKGNCRPFDSEADGFLQGEGVGAVVLKRLADASRDRDRIYAVIRGVGINNDGSGEGPMAPTQEGQLECLERALADGGVDPRTIGLVECHGTATPVGDPVEVGALRQAFAASEPERIYLSSVKANIGHTMSAAGIAGLIKAVLSLHHETIPPQANFTTPLAALGLESGPFAVPTQKIAWPRKAGQPRRAGVSSFGFGATNCHMIIEEAPSIDRSGKDCVELLPVSDDQAELVVLSAGTRELLSRYAREIAATVASDALAGATLGDIAYTLNATRTLGPQRLAVVAKSRQNLVDELLRSADRLAADGPLPLALASTAFFTPTGREDKPARIAFMFPGQGAQRLGLFRDLYNRNRLFHDRLAELEAAVQGILPAPLLSYLYAKAGNGDVEAAEQRLNATEVCQPVMAALGIALGGFLKELGIEPSVCLGHSLGEFAAMAVSGMISGQEAVRFVARLRAA